MTYTHLQNSAQEKLHIYTSHRCTPNRGLQDCKNKGREEITGGISRKWKRGQKPAKEEKVITKEGNTRLQYSRAQWGMIKKKMELW